MNYYRVSTRTNAGDFFTRLMSASTKADVIKTVSNNPYYYITTATATDIEHAKASGEPITRCAPIATAREIVESLKIPVFTDLAETHEYNYPASVRNDILDFILENFNVERTAEPVNNDELLQGDYYDTMWMCDSITGNASGSYWFNNYKAECALAHNWRVMWDAVEDYQITLDEMCENGAEGADVAIRAYLLPIELNGVVDSLEKNGIKVTEIE